MPSFGCEAVVLGYEVKRKITTELPLHIINSDVSAQPEAVSHGLITVLSASRRSSVRGTNAEEFQSMSARFAVRLGSCQGVGREWYCVDSVDQFNLALFEPSVLEDGVASQPWIRRVVDDGQAFLCSAGGHIEQAAGAIRTGLPTSGFVFMIRF